METCSDGFKKVIEEFQKDLSDGQKEMLSSTDIKKVKDSIKKIQDQLGAEGRLRNFNSLSKFLRGVESLEQLVQVFLQISEVGAFIWGPIKFSMTAASTRIEYLEMLLDVYHQIGDVLDGVDKYNRLFKRHPEARIILKEYFRGVLRFHLEVLKVFSKPGWKKCFTYAWPTFKSRFKPIIDSLNRYKNLLSDEKQTVMIEEIQELSTEFKEKISELMKAINTKDKDQQISLHYQLRAQIFAKLNPLDYEKDQMMAAKQRHVSKSGDWVLKNPQFIDWASGESEVSDILYLHGRPGSGKTTLASRIIDYMRSSSHISKGPVVFFYFKHDLKKDMQRTMSDMFRAIIAQFIDQDDSIIETANQHCANKTNSGAQIDIFLEDCTKHVLTSQRRAWIILDGLDECNEKHSSTKAESQVLKWLLEEVLPENQSHGTNIRLLISGQRDGNIETVLSRYPSINLDTAEGHISDINTYTRSQAAEIQQLFELEPGMGIDIAKKIGSVAQGMFLYAKVVMENLLLQESEQELEEELQQDNFPRGLEAAYERVVVRILDRAAPPRRKSAEKILGWLVCSARPLRWREIQSFFCIDPESSTCSYKKRRVSKCKIICGSLIDTSPCLLYGDELSEQEITLVHPTAGRYLANMGRVCLIEEHIKMSIFCCKYLISSPFSEELLAHSITEKALTGYYGLLDYATEFWDHHVQLILAPCESDPANRKIAMDATIDLLEKFMLNENSSGVSETKKIQRIELGVEKWVNAKHGSSNIQKRVVAIRKVMETINVKNEEDETLKPFLNLHGHPRFKCQRILCQKFAIGFRDVQDRNSHMRHHDRPFTCAIAACHAQITGFSSEDDLGIHMKRFHTKESSLGLFPGPKDNTELDIYQAASRGDLERIKLLQKSGVALDNVKRGGSLPPFVLAARNGQIEICKYFISQGIRPTSGVKAAGRLMATPVSEAIKKKDLELFLLIFPTEEWEHKTDRLVALAQVITSNWDSIIDELLLILTPAYVQHNIREIFEQCILVSSSPDYRPVYTEDSFLPAIKHMHRLICLAFPDLYEPDETTPRPRDPAQDEKNTFKQLQSALISRLGDSRLQTFRLGRKTILDFACEYGVCTVMECLFGLFEYSHLNIQNATRSTPLHWLVQDQEYPSSDFQKDCVTNVARKMATMDNCCMTKVKDARGSIPLHYVHRSVELLKVLICHTKNLDEENNVGETPVEVMMKWKETGKLVVELVRSLRIDLTRPGSNKAKLLEYSNRLEEPDRTTLVDLLNS